MEQRAEKLRSLCESGTPADLWYFISNETEIDRHVCKEVVFQIIFGAKVIETAIEYGLMLAEMVCIRAAFDQYTHEHRKSDAVHQEN